MDEVESKIPITMSLDFYNKITYLSNEYPKEIGGWITGEVRKDCIYLKDLLTPHQEVTGSSVEIDASACVNLVREFKEKCKDIIGHHHTHAGLGCFWSVTDEENMKQIMDPRKFFVFIVSSKGEHLVRVETKEPFRITADKLKYRIEDPRYEKVKEKLEKEIKKKVKEPEIKNYSSYNCSNDNFGLRSKNVTIYGSKEFNKPKTIVDLKDRGDGEDFSLEIADDILAEFEDKHLKIKGLDSYLAPALMEEFKEFKPELDDYGYHQQVTFNLKRKKARKILPMIQCVIEDYFENSDFRNY